MDLIIIGAIIAGLVSAWPSSGGTTEERADDTTHHAVQPQAPDAPHGAFRFGNPSALSQEMMDAIEEGRAAAADQLARAGHDPGPLLGGYTNIDYRDHRK